MRLVLQVIAAAKLGLQSTGYELNPWLVLASRVSATFNGVRTRTKFRQKDLWKVKYSAHNLGLSFLQFIVQVDLGQYDNIVFFGVDEMVSVEIPSLQ